MDRQILQRLRRGYKEVDSETGEYLTADEVQVGDETIKHGEEIDFVRLPNNLRFYKPQNTMNKAMEKRAAAGNAMYIRKRNGNMFVVSVDEEGNPRLFSSTLSPTPKGEQVPWLDRFPHLEVAMAGKLKPKTILLCEMVADEFNDDLDYVGQVLRSLTERAIEFQEQNHGLWLCVWDVAYLDGQQLIGNLSIMHRLTFVEDIVADINYLTAAQIVSVGEVVTPEQDTFGGTTEEAIMLAKEWGWEGWVVVDPEATYGEKGVSWHGKADRPKECCKLKPLWEADFILRWDPDNGIGTWGKGKKAGGVGAFFAYLCDPTGEEHFISKVGGGLTDEDVKKYAVPGLVMVGQVEFADITKDGSLQFPRFVRERHDKAVPLCTFDQLENIKKQIGG
jgi:ATP-dependent DNA ligase